MIIPSPLPLLLNKDIAAALCSMSTTTYDKHVKKGLLPPMNATGRVSLEALRRAVLNLDGIKPAESADDPAERALREWESG